jgi:predicted transcriptional regulator of viral defense system
MARARQIVADNKDTVNALASRLEERGYLNRTEILKFLNRRRLKRSRKGAAASKRRQA